MKSRSFNVLIVLALFFSLFGSAVTVTPARAAGIVVNSNADTVANNGECTLREAITNANGDNQSGSTDCAAGSGVDTITFAANYTITLVFSQLPAITTQMTITGNGAANTIIQAGTCNPVTLKDNANANCTPTQNYRMFEVGTTGNLTLNGITVRHGVCTSESNGCNTWGVVGGGIYNRGTLTMTGSVISGNLAHYGGGMFNLNSSSTLTNVTISGNSGIYNTGGMYNQESSSTLTNVTISGNSAQVGAGMQNDRSNPTLTNVTFSNNSATNNDGGGMYNFNNSSPTLTNVTFSGNSAYSSGGGMINFGGSPTLTNVTFSGNSANISGGGMYNASSSTPMLTNVIIANSTSGGNCYNDATSLNPASSHNLIDSASSCGLTDGNLGNKIGASYNAMLGPLANNGGSTQTHALLAGSDAIDAGNNTICAAAPVNNTSQNGVTRPQGAACDIGATETLNPIISVTIGGNLQGTYAMYSGQSMVQQYPILGGPVVIESNGSNIIASMLQLRRPGTSGGYTGITQLIGVQENLLSDTYVLPRYNGGDSSLYNSIQVANYENFSTNVSITIGGVLRGTYPLAAGESLNQVYGGVVGGPVVIASDNNARIIASLYELKRAGTSGTYTGQNQMMAVPQTSLSNTYVFPRYNDTLSDLDAYLVLANADSVATNVSVTIGGVLQGTYPMNPNTSQVVSYPVVGGPVVISSDNGADIIASMLQLRRPGSSGGYTGITQLIGVQAANISDTYVLPRYNGGDASLYNSVQVANYENFSTNVSIIIGGVLRGTYPLAAGESLNQVYSGLVSSPIVIESDNGARIIASLYELKRAGTSGTYTGQNQMMAVPFAQLSDTYIFPRYNDTLLDLDASLIFAVP